MSNVPMTLPELMLAEHETACGHSSTFIELDDRRLLHVAGNWKNHSEDGGLTWSPLRREEMVDVNGEPVVGMALVKLSDGGIGLAGSVQPPQTPSGPDGNARKGSYIAFWRSEDGGQTWEAPVAVTAPGSATLCLQDVALRTSSGRILVPVDTLIGQRIGPDNRKPPSTGKLVRGQWVSTAAHFTDPHFVTTYVCYSDDDGRSWQRNKDGDLFILHDWNSHFDFAGEPSVAEVAPGRLVMFLRTTLGRLYQAWSDDDGDTWTRPMPTSLAATTTPAQIRTLPTGHLLCVWNQENHDEVRRGFNRTRISSAISRNGGSVWEFFQNVQSLHETTRVEPGPIGPVRPAEQYFDPGQPAPQRQASHILSAQAHARWSYPSVFVMTDRVLIAHTYAGYQDHPSQAQIIRNRLDQQGNPIDQKLKVLPLSWFYGGKEPANNPFLTEAYEPARP